MVDADLVGSTRKTPQSSAALIADDADGDDGSVEVVGSAIEDAVARAGMTTMTSMGGGGS